jgi:hypothetical protein
MQQSATTHAGGGSTESTHILLPMARIRTSFSCNTRSSGSVLGSGSPFFFLQYDKHGYDGMQ